MNTVSIVGSVSRRAGGLFESVRRLHRELLTREGVNGARSSMDVDIRVQVLSLRDEFTAADLNAWAPVSVHLSSRFGPPAFGYAPGLIRQLLTLAPDLAHVHGLWQFTSLATLVWHRKTHKPYLVSPHGMLDPWALRHSRCRKVLGWLAYERAHLSSARCIRALCEAEAKAIRGLGLTNPICVIPNGVDLPPGPGKAGEYSRHTRCSSACNGLARNRKVLLYLGRIHPKKGLSNVLKAWVKVRVPPEWALVIAGWDQARHEAELKQLASELDIRWSDGIPQPNSVGSLFFAGPQFGAAKDDWLRHCDAFILPSYSEGMPMAVLEAWAYAKPVLMTPQCNLPDGFAVGAALCISPTPDSIASGLRELFELQNSARERMGRSGRALVSTCFTWPKVAGDLRAVYDWMTGAGPKPSCILSHR